MGAWIFIVDSALYLVSGLQYRNKAQEVPFQERRNTIFIQSWDDDVEEQKNYKKQTSIVELHVTNVVASTAVTAGGAFSGPATKVYLGGDTPKYL